MINDAAQRIIDKCDKICTALMTIGEEHAGYGLLQDLTGDIETMVRLLTEQHVGQSAQTEHAVMLMESVQYVIEALNNDDSVMIIDLLSYDLKAIVLEIQKEQAGSVI